MSDSMATTNESMIWCAKTGELQSLKTLLKEHPGKVNEQMNGRSLLHYAADAGNYDVLKELVDNGANVNSNDKFGLTPLLAAIYEDHTDCVKYLLEQVSVLVCP
ncbi:unnamed protein product [Rotaria socialis]|uniref:Myotrophin n=1 Tax=Rotaria socialis TaxID=392032 RepID=A0A818SS82_9BILA|nr:unnamed protein product [Rotaria socialis]CAF3344482.1 unnamed protein product [Rotaria socialis]CAF3363801.1 unnamed protein product [Rotaria socialis]CAF3437424.1 unnamed protein product [Rotaria socialis]CAF3675139.1 unnamed protein product [Rotaria socialis]